MFNSRIDELQDLIYTCHYTKENEEINSDEALKYAQFLLSEVVKNKGLVYIIGNGGSAGIASHFCTDLIKALEVPACTLADPGVLTCIGNDLGYEYVYSAQLKQNLREKDLLVAISSSGKSPNILNAVKVAKEKKASILTLSGFACENPLRSFGKLNFWVDSNDYGMIETAHFFLLHTIVDSISFAYAR